MARACDVDAVPLDELCSIFQRLRHGIFLWDRDLKLIARNDLVCEFYAMDASVIRPGIDLFDLISRFPDGTSATHLLLAGGEGVSREELRVRTLRDFDQRVGFELRFPPPNERVLIGNRAVFRAGVLATIVTDVTEREGDATELARQKAYLQTIIENLDEGIALIDSDLRCVAYNQRLLDLYSIDPDRVSPGAPLEDFIRAIGDLHLLPLDEREARIAARLRAASRRDRASYIAPLNDGRSIEIKRRSVDDGMAVQLFRDVSESVELERQRAYLQTIVDNMDGGVALVDENNVCVAFNRRLLELYGVDPERFHVGDRMEKFQQETADIRNVPEPLKSQRLAERTAAGLSRTEGTYSFMRETDAGLTLEVNRTSLPDGRLILIVNDVTDRVELARQRARLMAMVESVSEGVVLLDEDLNIVAFNQQLLDHYDVAPGTFHPGENARKFVMVQRDLDDLPPEERERRRAERLDFALDTKREPSVRRRELGNGRVLQVKRIPLEEGGALGVYRDITAEEEREALLKQARRDAERASRLKSEFLARISHELRTPMQGVLGMAALLERSELDNHQSHCLDVIRASGAHMLRLIEDLLTITTVDAEGMQLHAQPIALDGLVSDAVDMIRPQADDKGLSLTLRTPDRPIARVMADPTRVTQILINLLMNAVRYTAEGGVTVRLDTQPAVADTIEVAISVADTGRGISEDRHEQIFERFSQIPPEPGQVQEGVGLGLSVARSLAQASGGTISVRSAPGEGSVFTLSLTLPIAPDQEG